MTLVNPQSATISTGWYSINIGTGPLTERLVNLIKHIANNEDTFAPLWSKIRWRRGLLSLQELEEWDWPKPAPNVYIPRQFDPSPLVGELPPKPDYGLGFIQQYFRRGEFGEDPAAAARQNNLEASLITLAFVLVPLARAELNRARRQFDAALRDLRWVLDSILVRRTGSTPEDPAPRRVYARIACEFIELPFAKLLLAETMLDKADTEYKTRSAADPPPAPDVTAYQGLKAAQTYLAVKTLFADEGEYVPRVDAGRDELANQVQQRLAANDTRSQTFQLLGKDILVPTITSLGTALPGLDRRKKAHEPLLKFTPPAGQDVMRETNPRVYAALLSATARLEQLEAGFNYLGYLDAYVPPWRFQFLLERARYFAEHAKNAQRDYLNFLSNVEREEFQELSASQNVEMEKSNIQIETARVDQANAEVAAAQESKELADLTAADAQKRLAKYEEFDQYADSLFGTLGPDPLEFLSDIANVVPGVNAVLTAVGDVFTLGAISNRKQSLLADAQRGLEQFNLSLAADEASKAAEVADKQKDVAVKGSIVAGLQRQAALLRHEFAIQNLQFLRNRVLSAEQWYRLVAGIRSISETYLRYSVELAFLAEQAYEFEADKRINVIRFRQSCCKAGKARIFTPVRSSGEPRFNRALPGNHQAAPTFTPRRRSSRRDSDEASGNSTCFSGHVGPRANRSSGGSELYYWRHQSELYYWRHQSELYYWRHQSELYY